MTTTLSWLIAVSTWLTPQPQLSQGLLVNYGSQYVVERVARYHGYDLSPYSQRCGIASISPVHLGQVAWIKVGQLDWFGPCLVIDVMARKDAYVGIYINHEIAEIPRWLASWFGFTNGAQGLVWFGACPPMDDSMAQPYQPVLEWDRGDRQPNFWPYPAQQLPTHCSRALIQ